jgi:hypothetical protein
MFSAASKKGPLGAVCDWWHAEHSWCAITVVRSI